MNNQYIKNSKGGGVLLADTTVLDAAQEKKILQTTIVWLQQQIDILRVQIKQLQENKKD